MKQELTILIPAHDSCLDIVEIYLSSLKKYWVNCQYDIIWSNNSLNCDLAPIKILNNREESSFCERILNALDSIQTKYVLLQMEDYIYSATVNNDDIQNIIEFMKKERFRFCKLCINSTYGLKEISNHKRIYVPNNNLPYGVSLNCGIFEVDYLRELILDKNWSGWDLEKYMLKLANEEKIERCIWEGNDILHVKHLISKGKFIPKSYKELKKVGIDVDISKREFLDKKERLRIFMITILGNRLVGKKRIFFKKLVSKLGIKVITTE